MIDLYKNIIQVKFIKMIIQRLINQKKEDLLKII